MHERHICEIKQDWQINLLCQKALESAQMPLLPSDGIRRVISTLAGGVLLPGGLGIKDPCEKDNTDAFASLSLQGNGLDFIFLSLGWFSSSASLKLQ